MVSITQNIHSRLPQVFTGKTVKKNENQHVVGIIDSFNIKNIDVDGDGIKDCSHGKFCKVVSKSANPDLKIINFRLRHLPKRPRDESMDSVIEKFNEVANRIKKGEKIEAINFSFGISKSFDELSKYMETSITKDNVHEHKEKIRNWLKKLGSPEMANKMSEIDKEKLGLEKLYEAITAIEEVTKLGIPVYIAAGNDGSQYFNLYNLAEGSIVVGALDSDKEDAQKTGFTSDNSIVKRFGKGVFHTTNVLKKDNSLAGYSIMDDNQVEFKKNEVSNMNLKENRFINRPVKDVLADENDYQTLKIMKYSSEDEAYNFILENPDAAKKINYVLFEIDKFAEIFKLKPDKVISLKKQGDYTGIQATQAFRVDKNGKVIYDPENSGKNVLNDVKGTSFATPFVMAKDMQRKYSQDKNTVISFKAKKLDFNG